MHQILVVEDDESIAQMTKLCLTKHRYACDIAPDGDTACEMVDQKRYDLVLLDIMLPGMDGFEVLSYLKRYDIPTIFLSAKSTTADRIKGLQWGADDYLGKPFDLQELVARIETVLRRYYKLSQHLSFGRIEIDALSRTVWLEGETVPLTAKEYDLLLYLIRNKNIALYREKIYEQVWQEPYYGNTRTVDIHVQRLKKKLKLGDAIQTIYTVGYQFIPEKLQ